jgi:pimeloyl-ACP methyl ester carboxylesterase
MSAAAWKDSSPHASRFIEANGIRINYLDWGGTGEPLVLIPGYTDNPHIFDELAPRLTSRARVIAYARRGHGLTDAKPPYDGGTLLQDLVSLLDALQIERTALAGRSMGGNETTAFAGQHPDRTDRIVYLEGGYDYSDPACLAAWKAFPVDSSPPESAFVSWPAYLSWHHQYMFPGLADLAPVEAYLRELAVEQPDGSLKFRWDTGAIGAMWGTLAKDPRNYARIRAPALAIYGTSFESVGHGEPDRRAKFQEWEEAHWGPFRTQSADRIRKELTGSQILTVPGTHADFQFTSRDAVARAMVQFLGD